LVAYAVFVSKPAPTLLHAPPNIPVLSFSGSVLQIFVFASSSQRLRRIVRVLDGAAYPVGLTVNLVIVSARQAGEYGRYRLETAEMQWRHGRYRFEESARVVGDGALVVILTDTMEISPFFAYWYLHSAPVSIGGGDLSRPVGLAFTGVESLNSTIIHTQSLVSLLHNILALCNCSAKIPSDRVYVRDGWQDPVRPERSPKLARTWAL
jgi:hypothetical protein